MYKVNVYRRGEKLTLRLYALKDPFFSHKLFLCSLFMVFFKRPLSVPRKRSKQFILNRYQFLCLLSNHGLWLLGLLYA